MTEQEIVSVIMNGVTSYEGVTPVSLFEDQVAAEVDTLRSRMIDDIDKAGLFRRPFSNFVQDVELEVKRRNDQTSYIEIPRLYILRSNVPAIAYIGSTNRNNPQPYRIMSGSQWINSKHDLFVSKIPAAVYSEQTIELKFSSAKNVRIIGVFEDPSDLNVYGYDDSKSDYPMPAGMIDQLTGKLIESYIRQLYRTPVQANKQADTPQQQ